MALEIVGSSPTMTSWGQIVGLGSARPVVPGDGGDGDEDGGGAWFRSRAVPGPCGREPAHRASDGCAQGALVGHGGPSAHPSGCSSRIAWISASAAPSASSAESRPAQTCSM